MSADRIEAFRSTIKSLAQDWVSHPRGESFDNGMCESELRSLDLTSFLEETKSEQDMVVLFDRLHALQGKVGTEQGNWSSRQFDRSLAAFDIFGRRELDAALTRSGFADDLAAAQRRAEASLVSFESSAPPAGRPAAALRFDVQAYLSDPRAIASVSPFVLDTYRQILDEADEDASFRVLSRKINAASKKLEAGGHKNATSGMAQVLSNFGNPDSPFFGIVVDHEGTQPARRYRTPGR